jgi:hypothetical protein
VDKSIEDLLNVHLRGMRHRSGLIQKALAAETFVTPGGTELQRCARQTLTELDMWMQNIQQALGQFTTGSTV